jgi:hypothetical protein
MKIAGAIVIVIAALGFYVAVTTPRGTTAQETIEHFLLPVLLLVSGIWLWYQGHKK